MKVSQQSILLNKIENRNLAIDCLRGICILWVILLHINIRIPYNKTFLGSILPERVYKLFFWSGYYGVCIFFVISGFLITSSALTKWGSLQSIKLKEFYVLRFARIAPLLILLLIILSLLHLLHVSGYIINTEKTPLAVAVLAALTFQINMLEIFAGWLPASWDVLWSLSIEEMFYLLFPVVCLLLKNNRNLLVVVVLCLIVSPVARTMIFTNSETGDRNHLAFLDALSIGCTMAVLVFLYSPNHSILKVLLCVGSALFCIILIFGTEVYRLGITKIGLNVTILSIGIGMLLIWMVKVEQNQQNTFMMLTKPVQSLGKYSYEIYLTHSFVVIGFVAVFNHLKLSPKWIHLLYVAVVALSGLLGMLVAKYFSIPMNIFVRKKMKVYNKPLIL